MKNIQTSSDWIRVALLLAKRNFMLYGIENKKTSFTTVYSHHHVLKGNRSALSIKDKNEDADDTVFQIICKNVLNVVFLI